MARAKCIAQWSKDPKHKVGAVIVDTFNHVISEGYNGPPRGVRDTLISNEVLRLRTLHAEMNAILHAQGRNLQGSRIYIYPFGPCSTCAAMMVQVGITEVHFAKYLFTSAWASSQHEALNTLDEAKVKWFVEGEINELHNI